MGVTRSSARGLPKRPLIVERISENAREGDAPLPPTLDSSGVRNEDEYDSRDYGMWLFV